MKTKNIVVSLAIAGLIIVSAFSCGQKTDKNVFTAGEFRRMELLNRNPYAIFGKDAAVTMTSAEEKSDYVLRVSGKDKDGNLISMELDAQTGVARLFDKDGTLIGEELLGAGQKARWFTQDRFAEKYYPHSPYSYAVGNPIRYIDMNGDSILVASQYQAQFNSSLEDVFGEYASNFNYTESGMLSYSGNTKDLNRRQRKILKKMSQTMKESTVTEVHYTNTHSMTDNAENTITVNLKELGSDGVALLGSENNMNRNYIIVSPNPSSTHSVNAVTSAYYSDAPIMPGDTPRFEPTIISTNSTDIVFHELGHVIYQGHRQNRVLDFNNTVRKQIELPKRPYDETHNRKVRHGMY